MDMNSAYAAGLIDGEGCVHLDVPRRTTYRARVSVGMSQPALGLLTDLQDEWGGTLYQQRKATERWAAAWTWHLTGEPAVRLLVSVRPWLRLKGRQADLALEVESIRSALAKRPNGQCLWTPEARAQCEALKQEMHALNAKGPRVPALSVGGV